MEKVEWPGGYTERGGEGVLRVVKRGEGHFSVEIVHSF